MSDMKYILVTGGVISGVGKGVIASSFGTILKSCGIEVTSIKIDPYINLDAGTFSPYEHGSRAPLLSLKKEKIGSGFVLQYHKFLKLIAGENVISLTWVKGHDGEVYVLDDGGEVDLDLGNYERFLNITLHRDNNITTGKIYKMVIDKERRGDYLGKTVQVVPHITDAIQEWVERVAKIPVSDKKKTPQVCIVELGGTIGDIESAPFVEAFRQFQFRAKKENFCVAHVSLIPQPRSTGEPKTKPTQASVRELRGLGLSPDFIICRSEKPILQNVKEKISNFCHVAPDQVICIHDLSSIYKVPILMESNGIVEYLNERLQLGIKSWPRKQMKQWSDLADKIDNLRHHIHIALVGKYTRLEDSYTSVTKALQHAANTAGYKMNVLFIEASNLEKETLETDPVAYHEAWKELCKSEGVIVPGGFGKRGIEGKIEASRWCRENGKPFLGICLGFQTSVIEFARNVLKLEKAHSTECDSETAHPVIVDMPEHNTGDMGGTMRLGKRLTVFKLTATDTKIKRLYGNKESIEERHRHRYEVNPKYITELEKGGLQFVGVDTEAERMEILELENHPYYVAVQFHPEYLSRPMNPSPPFMGLILASKDQLKSYLARGCKLSPRESDYYDSEEEEIELNVKHISISRVNESDSSAYSSSTNIMD